MTRTVRDARSCCSAMASHDPKDSTSVDVPVPDYEAALSGDRARACGSAFPKEYRIDGMPAEIDALWAARAPTG